jgi:pimeloyl-ACP methyl ester carboxylesterase
MLRTSSTARSEKNFRAFLNSTSNSNNIRLKQNRLIVKTAHAMKSATDTHLSSFAVNGLFIKNHALDAPLFHQNLHYRQPNRKNGEAGRNEMIKIFLREIVSMKNKDRASNEMKTLLYLQGGPGFECARVSEKNGWIGEMVERNFRVFLIDQRGTGMSSALTRQKIEREECGRGNDCDGESGGDSTNLIYYRADSIVEDCEIARRELLGEGKKWDVVLGQSFGGFCLTTYLSFYGDEAIKQALLTGGVPPLSKKDPKDAYLKLLDRAKAQTIKYYKRFPGDKMIVNALVKLSKEKVCTTLNGNIISPRGIQALGFALGTAGGFERLHYMFENAINREEEEGEERISDEFMNAFDKFHAFDSNPLYAILHESIYMDGHGIASNFAAERAIQERSNEFDPLSPQNIEDGMLFTGEMVLPFFYDELKCLAPFKEIASSLQDRTDWPKLYDLEKLRKCTVPTACALYLDDMFVDFDLATEVVNEFMGPNTRVYATNEYMHSGIREDGKRILDKLLAMTNDEDPLR